jgi:hypothetical protein
MKKLFQLTAAAMMIAGMVACTSKDDSLLENGNAAIGQPELITLDGGSDYIELANGEQAAWQIVDCPDWMVPVAEQGSVNDVIRIYVESNRRLPLRTGNITIRYANGKKHVTRAEQDDEQPGIDMRRSYAAGWGFDVRTYNDSRGLRDQIFNIQRLINYDKNIYRNVASSASKIDFYYGDDISNMQNDMKAKLNVDGKFGLFSLDLKASFGMSALNDSKRIFSWIRDITCERKVYFDNLDTYDAQTAMLFTSDFARMRQEVIASEGADSTISRLINNYGTHYVETAELGGCYDYYYSSTYDNSQNNIDVKATINFAYSKKFNFSAGASYEDQLKQMDQETIEKFSVKGGESVKITNKVFAGSITMADTDAWKESLKAGKWELLHFELLPIYDLFPDDIAEKIKSYLDRLYYSEVPVTRSAE